MIIKKISIKNFGKLSDVNIFPEDGLNVIFGANESGKTTLLSFIKYIFYGTKQKKNYKDLTFKEKYMPWNSMPVSGCCEIEYDGCNYSIQRSDGDGLSKLTVINLDKGTEEKSITSPGQHFFGIGEKAFNDSLYIRDLSLISDFSDSGELNAFLTDSSVENSTYQIVRSELNDRLANIISTKRKNSLITNLNNQIEDNDTKLRTFQARADELEDKVKNINQIEKEICDIKSKITELNHKRKNHLANEADQEKNKLLKEKELIEKEILQSSVENILSDEEKNLLLNDFNEYDEVINKNRYNKIKYSILELLTASFGLFFLVLSKFISILLITLSVFWFGCFIYFLSKFKKTTNSIKSTEQNLLDQKRKQQLLREKLNLKSKSECLIYISSLNNSIGPVQYKYLKERLNTINNKLEIFKNTSHLSASQAEISSIDTIFFTNHQLDDIIKEKYVELDALSAELGKLIPYKNELSVLMEDIAGLRNEQIRLSDEKEYLKNEADIIECSLSILENSYMIARESYFPKLAKLTVEIFNFISEENYDSVKFDESFEIMFNKDSFFRSAKFLSSGTYDILYLALRIAIIEIIDPGNLKLPVFMDDIFANCDDLRASRLVDVIHRLSCGHQIFMTTCRNREIELLNSKKNINTIVM